MCLAFYAINQHPDYPIIIAANRDEFHARPTQSMHWWDEPTILAGKDLQAGGSWLALDAKGRFAMVTNVRRPPLEAGELSRGQLVTDFLKKKVSATNFIQQLDNNAYAGFNLVVGDLLQAQLFHHSNYSTGITSLNKGIHGLSNASLNTDWPKVTSGKQEMQALCEKPYALEDWFDLLADQRRPLDQNLPNTGIDLETERLLSSRFILSEEYGTRCSTVITVDKNKTIRVEEKNFDRSGLETSQHSFQIT